MPEYIDSENSEDCSVREDQGKYSEEEKKEKEFWNALGRNEGYIGVECPNCGRVRVEHWSCGKDICEKCHWCIQDHGYFTNEFFDL